VIFLLFAQNQFTPGTMLKMRKRDGSIGADGECDKENMPAQRPWQIEVEHGDYHQPTMTDNKILRVLEDDIVRRRSFERRTERRLEEVFNETQLLRRDLHALVKLYTH
jgi:hypothetical protein